MLICQSAPVKLGQPLLSLATQISPERKDPETLGTALFNNETFEGWADLYSINSASIFFVTTALMGLLSKGSADVENYWSTIINITSISGVIKVAQEHVSTRIFHQRRVKDNLNIFLVLLQ